MMFIAVSQCLKQCQAGNGTQYLSDEGIEEQQRGEGNSRDYTEKKFQDNSCGQPVQTGRGQRAPGEPIESECPERDLDSQQRLGVDFISMQKTQERSKQEFFSKR